MIDKFLYDIMKNGQNYLLCLLGIALLVTSCTAVFFIQKGTQNSTQKVESSVSADSASVDVKIPLK